MIESWSWTKGTTKSATRIQREGTSTFFFGGWRDEEMGLKEWSLNRREKKRGGGSGTFFFCG